MKLLLACYLLIALSFFSACSSSPTIKIETTPPGASVKIIEPSTGELAVLGDTPVEVGAEKIDAFTSDLLLVELSHDNYLSERFWLPNTPRFRSMAKAELEVKLRQKPKLESVDMVRDTWNRAVKSLLDGQRLIVQKKFGLAEAKLKETTELVGSFTEAKRLLGTLYYLKGARESSKKIWKEILEINPNDKEAYKMLKVIESSSPSEND